MAKRVLIVGAGVIGLSTAYYCARRGDRVTVVDRHPPRRDGCSFGNAGMVVPSHIVPLAAPGVVRQGLKWLWDTESPFTIRPRWSWEMLAWGYRFWRSAAPEHVRRSAPILRDLNLASRHCFAELAQSAGNEFGLVQNGLLMLCQSQKALDEEAHTATLARELSLPAEVLDPAQAAALDPEIRMEILGAVYFPLDCHLSPARFMDWLQQQLIEMGTQFIWNAEAEGWDVTGDRLHALQSSQGTLAADEFVLCGGAWSARLGQGLRLRLPMQAGKGYSLTLTHPRQLPRICAILTEARVAVTPIGSSLRVAGTMEIAGLDSRIDARRVRGIMRSVCRYYPEFQLDDFAHTQPWCGLRPCSPDGLPYVGRTRRYRNLSIATGHAMMGLSLAPVTGQLISELLAGQSPSIDLTALSPDRYA